MWDTATGTWKTTGDGGSESSGVVEITFSGARGYEKDLPVATAMKLVASGTYSQTSKATIDYDYSTKSELVASGVVTTTGKGTTSLSGSSHTWWNGGTGEGKLTAPDGTNVSHTEDGDRTSSATLTSQWVFSGGGWQEQQTVLDSSGASKGSFSSSMNRSWNVAGDPDGDGPGTYSKGSLVHSATGSHDYTSSSKLTRTAVDQGGFAVTGWRKGGGESHGTSSVDYHDFDTREYLKQADVVANDAYDYTNDSWKITFDATGMPKVQYSGSLETSEHYSSVHKGVINAFDGVIDLEKSRTRSGVTDEAPWFLISPGRGGFGTGFGNSFSVANAGYGYDESKTMPAAFGGGAPEAATPPEAPSGASVVPKGISSEALNYETRLADLSKPRAVTSGSRPLGSGSANLPTMPKITTPAVGALGFTKSDAAAETPQTRAFASLVTSGMAGPVGAMADSSQADGFLSTFMTRLGGAFSAAGGAAEVVLGGMLFGGSAVATFGSGGTAAGLGIPGMIGGAALGAHGIDEFLAGFQTAWDGTVHRPYTAQGLDAVTGNPVASDWINAAGGMIGSAGAGAALKSLKAAAATGLGLGNQNLLYKAATGQFKNSALSPAGRALTKHPEVIGKTKETLRQSLRTDGAINDAAHNALRDIMRRGITTTPTTGRFGTVTDIQIPGGFGARWGSDGSFIGFLNP